jgi:hypothetical protein
MDKLIHPVECPNCGVYSYRTEGYNRCAICSKNSCISCMKDYSLGAVLHENASDKESQIFYRICCTFGREYRLVCVECFHVRTMEVLREYPIDDMGLLVNSTLIPLCLIKDRLREG